jgi:predicted ATPase
VTFLFTDIEGSTRVWETAPTSMREALAQHDEIIRKVTEAHGGYVFATGGDGFAAAFTRAGTAAAAALDAQRALGSAQWPDGAHLKVRMAMHTGEAEERDGDYFGTAVNRAARLMAVAHGGQLVCSSVTAALLEGVELIDLGEHRLRDLTAPQRVFQVGTGVFPPLRSLDALPGNLPHAVSSFVGREDELSALAEAVRTDRLVTITGVGGVGKTRLALQAAAGAVAAFTDGAWLCELAAASTGEELAQVVAVALGVVQRPQMTLVASIVDFLRSRDALVVLDNCEHLLDAAAAVAEAVLTGAPRVHVLATSREGLGVQGEQVWPLRSLRLDEGLSGTSEAVELFATRARSADSGFLLDDENLPAVAEVCRRLDGIPLAIELAAARAATMSPAEIAGHLDERFRLLTGARRRGTERHQTLRSAIAWSHSLLSVPERSVFDRLGVFPTSFDEAAAVAVASTDDIERWDVIDALDALVAKSMVVVERSAGTRYRLLETLRHFARDQLESHGETDDAYRRHGRHYAALAATIGAGLLSRDELRWRARLSEELDNLRAAVGWAFDSEGYNDAVRGVELIKCLLPYCGTSTVWGVQAWAPWGLPWLDGLLGEERVVVLGGAVIDAYHRGDLDGATTFARRAEDEAAGRFTPALAVAYLYHGLATAAAGDAQEALALLSEALELRTASALTMQDVGLLVESGLGWVAYNAGDLGLARAVASSAVHEAQSSEVPALIAVALCLLARVLPDDRADEALNAAEESMRLIDEGAGAETNYAPAGQTAAMLLASRNEPVRAASALHRAVSYSAARGESPTTASTMGIAVFVLAVANDQVGAATVGGAIELGALTYRVLSEEHRRRHEGALQEVARALGPAAYDAARQNGASMTSDEAIQYALERLELVRGLG